MSQLAPAPDDTGRLAHRPTLRLSGPWLLVARSVWLLLASGLFANVIVAIPVYYLVRQTICTSDLAECSFSALPTPDTLRALHQVGLSLPGYASLCHSCGGGSPAGLLERWSVHFLAQVY